MCSCTQGFVGTNTFRGRLEAVRTPPPYDDFRQLEESWSAMRTVVEVCVCLCLLVRNPSPSHDANVIEPECYAHSGWGVCVCACVRVCEKVYIRAAASSMDYIPWCEGGCACVCVCVCACAESVYCRLVFAVCVYVWRISVPCGRTVFEVHMCSCRLSTHKAGNWLRCVFARVCVCVYVCVCAAK